MVRLINRFVLSFVCVFACILWFGSNRFILCVASKFFSSYKISLNSFDRFNFDAKHGRATTTATIERLRYIHCFVWLYCVCSIEIFQKFNFDKLNEFFLVVFFVNNDDDAVVFVVFYWTDDAAFQLELTWMGNDITTTTTKTKIDCGCIVRLQMVAWTALAVVGFCLIQWRLMICLTLNLYSLLGNTSFFVSL